MRPVAILDTSWLLELYRVPGDSKQSRALDAQRKTAGIVSVGCELFVTVPVLFEVASHITRVCGKRRRNLRKRLLGDIEKSFALERPWTIVGVDGNVLLRSEDLIQLAKSFLENFGPNYSFANISIIDLATELRKRKRTVRILTSNEKLAAYSDR